MSNKRRLIIPVPAPMVATSVGPNESVRGSYYRLTLEYEEEEISRLAHILSRKWKAYYCELGSQPKFIKVQLREYLLLTQTPMGKSWYHSPERLLPVANNGEVINPEHAARVLHEELTNMGVIKHTLPEPTVNVQQCTCSADQLMSDIWASDCPVHGGK